MSGEPLIYMLKDTLKHSISLRGLCEAGFFSLGKIFPFKMFLDIRKTWRCLYFLSLYSPWCTGFLYTHKTYSGLWLEFLDTFKSQLLNFFSLSFRYPQKPNKHKIVTA